MTPKPDRPHLCVIGAAMLFALWSPTLRAQGAGKDKDRPSGRITFSEGHTVTRSGEGRPHREPKDPPERGTVKGGASTTPAAAGKTEPSPQIKQVLAQGQAVVLRVATTLARAAAKGVNVNPYVFAAKEFLRPKHTVSDVDEIRQLQEAIEQRERAERLLKRELDMPARLRSVNFVRRIYGLLPTDAYSEERVLNVNTNARQCLPPLPPGTSPWVELAGEWSENPGPPFAPDATKITIETVSPAGTRIGSRFYPGVPYQVPAEANEVSICAVVSGDPARHQNNAADPLTLSLRRRPGS